MFGEDAMIRRLFAAITSGLSRALRIGAYTVEGELLTKRDGLWRTKSINLGDIRSWACFPEMVFDIVEIRLKTGESLRWLDACGGLTRALRRRAPEREDHC